MNDKKALSIIKISDKPELAEFAANWFASKWNIPLEAYRESMQEGIRQPKAVPQWYILVDNQGRIVGGAGIIENDFHERKDLSPNVCALYVEKEHRNKGLARRLLDHARQEAGAMGYKEVYLITDHKDFYEKCGWEYLTDVNCDGGEVSRMYRATTLK